MKSWLRLLVPFLLWPVLCPAQQAGEVLTQLLTLPMPESMEFCGEAVPLQRQDVAERLDSELVVTLGSPVRTTLWLKRLPRYFPLIEEALRQRGLPEDLKYVALVESNLRADAESWAGAVGPWQFIRRTGSECGLEQNAWTDQRRDWEAATSAALDHLSGLRESLGSWPLALAAYNAGRQRITDAMEEQGEVDYYSLKLPRETERYVFRALAAKLVVEDPLRYGIQMEGARRYGPQPLVEMEIEVSRRHLPLQALAKAAGISYYQLTQFNPWMVGSTLPMGRHRILLPAEEREVPFAAALALWEAQNPEAKQVYHQVRRGDTLSAIAQQYQVRLPDLLSWNGLSNRSIIRPGQSIVIQTVD